LQECEAFLEDRMEVMQLLIPFDRYDLVTQLHAQGGIRSKKAAEAGIAVVATVPRRLLEQYAPYQLKP
jgi:50S ribosomal subunit-associated GTPase HflX